MMTSNSKKPAEQTGPIYPRKSVTCALGATDEESAMNYAKLITSSDLAAYRVIHLMQPKNLADAIDVPTLMATLRDQAAAVQSGDLAHPEAMLINQASALQSLFVRLSERAMEQTLLPNLEAFMRLALRAQSQCRATLETLAAIKNPPIVYARQANVTTGPQQINNGTVAPIRARKIVSEQTQLSETTNELLPDARAPGNACRVNSTLETVAEFNRAEVH